MSENTDRFRPNVAALEVRLAAALAERDAAIAERDVLAKLVNLWPAARIDELMPWAWRARTSITVTQQAAA